MYEICEENVSCKSCKHKCPEYLEEYEYKEIEELMQGNDRQPMKRIKGALRRK